MCRLGSGRSGFFAGDNALNRGGRCAFLGHLINLAFGHFAQRAGHRHGGAGHLINGGWDNGVSSGLGDVDCAVEGVNASGGKRGCDEISGREERCGGSTNNYL